MVISPFVFTSLPHIVFGCGSFTRLAEITARHGKRALVLTGGSSFVQSDWWKQLRQDLTERYVQVFHQSCAGEPSPELVDLVVTELQGEGIDVVVAVGGGSVIDTGKAISAMLLEGDSVIPYLEGVGTGKSHSGRKVPFIAVPTTGGTGSEATKNAVLGNTGPDGFKRSLRHDNFIPNVALVDPNLALSCPSNVTAACGMDALTQLFESYVSTAASPMTNAMALEGLACFTEDTMARCIETPGDTVMRSRMSLAALLSGITLANAGLGVVHGLASVIGGLFNIPHGVVCGTLLAEATRMNIEKLAREKGWDCPELKKHARAAAALRLGEVSANTHTLCQSLAHKFKEWTVDLALPRLGAYGISGSNIPKIVSQTSLKNNPIKLSPNEIEEIIRHRL